MRSDMRRLGDLMASFQQQLGESPTQQRVFASVAGECQSGQTRPGLRAPSAGGGGSRVQPSERSNDQSPCPLAGGYPQLGLNSSIAPCFVEGHHRGPRRSEPARG